MANVSLTGLKKHHLQAGSFMNRTRNQTQALKNSDPNFVKIAKYHLVETKDQIEYISRGSNSAKSKDQNSNILRKAGSSELPKHL